MLLSFPFQGCFNHIEKEHLYPLPPAVNHFQLISLSLFETEEQNSK